MYSEIQTWYEILRMHKYIVMQGRVFVSSYYILQEFEFRITSESKSTGD